MQGEYAAYAGRVLVQKAALLENSHLEGVDPQQDLTTRGLVWGVSFRMTTEGAKRFEVAAKELFNRRPRGMIAIMLDGRVHSMHVIQSSEFGGKVQVSGVRGTETESRELARVLRSGLLPVPLELVEERPAGR